MLYDGTLGEERGFAAIGGPAEALADALAADFEPDRGLGAARAATTAAFESVLDRDVEGWEVAILERNGRRRTFRRLD